MRPGDHGQVAAECERLRPLFSPRAIARRCIPGTSVVAARSRHDRGVADQIGRTGSNSTTECIHRGGLWRVWMDRLCLGVEATAHIADQCAWRTGTPVPRCRVALHLLL